MSESVFHWQYCLFYNNIFTMYVNSLKMFVIVGSLHRRLTYMFLLSKQWLLHQTVFHLHPHYMCKFYIQTGTQTVLIGLCCIKTCQWLSANCSWSGTLNSFQSQQTPSDCTNLICVCWHGSNWSSTLRLGHFGKIKISRFLGSVLKVLAVSSS